MNQILVPILLVLSISGVSGQSPRIITAGSAVTETVCALGDCDKIIASDRTSLYPEHIQRLPSIGYRTSINAEGILSLKPDLVIAEKDYVDETVLRHLESSGVRLVLVEPRYDFEGTRTLIQTIAAALGREEEGRKLLAANESQLAEAKSLLAKAAASPKVVCIFNRGAATVSVAGKNTFAGILQYAGARNAIPEISGYKPLNAESLIAANPDFIVMTSSGLESIGGIEGALKIPGVRQTTAGQKRQIVGLDVLKLTNFGPRTGETVKELVLLLHPELKEK